MRHAEQVREEVERGEERELLHVLLMPVSEGEMDEQSWRHEKVEN